MSVALVIHPDGDIMELNLPANVHDNLTTMCKVIGCRLVDVVALTDRLDMWLDDEGIYEQQVNPVATALARRFGYTWQDYHGPVVLCSVDQDGNSIDLTRDQLLGLLNSLLDVAEEV
jgi:hypothetical protein